MMYLPDCKKTIISASSAIAIYVFSTPRSRPSYVTASQALASFNQEVPRPADHVHIQGEPFLPPPALTQRVLQELRQLAVPVRHVRALARERGDDVTQCGQRLLLMCWASRRRSPVASDRSTRSLPARSTRCRQPRRMAPESSLLAVHVDGQDAARGKVGLVRLLIGGFKDL